MVNMKKITKKLNITSKKRDFPITLNAEVFSFDNQSTSFIFNIDKDKCSSLELNLEEFEALITMTFDKDDKAAVMYDKATVINYNTIEYKLNDKLDGFDGLITMNIALKSLTDDSSVDVADVVFKKTVSTIDKYAGQIPPDFSFEGYDDMVKKAQEQIKKDIEDGLQIPHASKDVYGFTKIGKGINVEDGVISVDPSDIEYELPVASKEMLGGVKVGDNLTISQDGKLNAQANVDWSDLKFEIDSAGHLFVEYPD